MHLPSPSVLASVRLALIWFAITIGLSGISPSLSEAANFSEAESLYRRGSLEEAKKIAAEEVERGIWNRRWSELLIQCQLDTGDYSEALATYEAAIDRYPTSLPLRVLGIRVARYNDLPDRVALEKARIERDLQTGRLRYATADTLVAAGRFFSKNGIDARIILKSFYDRVLENDPLNLEALIATAELAVEKGDYKVAADSVQRAKQRGLEDARLDYLLAVALQPTDAEAASQALSAALQANPVYVPSLVLQAENEIDRELYEQAAQTIDKILAINPKDESAFALQAVLAHLKGDYAKENELRRRALEHYPDNPEVDHLIGRKLSDKYRFAEGAEYQRRALTADPTHLAATFQLAQDLLRLGDEKVGWELAEQVNTADPYNVVAYNLMTLKDRVDGFVTRRIADPVRVEVGDLLVRMSPTEDKIYGQAVADLLVEARNVLCEKYDLTLRRPVLVEIYPKQGDFAIRTFGLPGGEGFLGVCFGNVVTANSPASQGPRPSNWKSVLWHEFCHVVTLTKTNNRMPRWLSEGISVYEERLRDPTWGQSMTPRYREMILGEDLTPIGRLSSAFLAPPSPTHLQFAYYESSLVVEFLIEQYGEESFNAVLDSLADGVAANDAIAMNIAPLERLELQFAEYAHELANSFAPDLEFDREDYPDPPTPGDVITWAKSHPDNYWGKIAVARDRMKQNDFAGATKLLEELVAQGAATGEREGVLELLAQCYRKQDDRPLETQTLTKLLERSSDALPALERMIEIERERENWDAVRELCERSLGIQPLSLELQQTLSEAYQRLGKAELALPALRARRAMNPVDVAGLEFEMAQAHVAAGDHVAAEEHLVEALLIAPRFRNAHRLLLTVSRAKESEKDESSQEDEDSQKASDGSQKESAVEPAGNDEAPEKSDSSEDAEKPKSVSPEPGASQPADPNDEKSTKEEAGSDSGPGGEQQPDTKEEQQ
ncbi:peptidase MA family metallohydrolase [Roseiconus nitratireducens]|uniref:peptidase MA family metallohydrolase n=1 Tax=Roseiconus nitratireducens TaxID=2605748 RepID=UPI001F43E1CC|nr:tetratricopeptide repeat protein [Roseiconus nitratireducens]